MSGGTFRIIAALGVILSVIGLLVTRRGGRYASPASSPVG